MEVKAPWKKCISRALVLIAYSLLGIFTFMKIEGKDEKNKEVAQRLLQGLRDEFRVKMNLTDVDFQDFVQRASDAMAMKEKKDWTFLYSLEYVMTALTTIGYGDITAETPLGQGLTILYCIIGIPLELLFLKTVGEMINYAIIKVIMKFERKIPQKVNINLKKRKIQCFFITVLLALCMMLLSGLVETCFDNMTFIEGMYIWFTTMTTIGFGDYIPANNYREKVNSQEQINSHTFLLIALMFFPMAFGLAIVAAIVDSFVKCYEDLKSVNICRCWKAQRSTVTVEASLDWDRTVASTLRTLQSPESQRTRRYSV